MRLHMKWVFAAGVLLGLGATGAASAADMAVKARPVAPPIMYNWQGCYIGGNLGAGWSKMDTTQVGDDVLGPVFNDYGREKDSAFIGGAQAGCDFMAGNNLQPAGSVICGRRSFLVMARSASPTCTTRTPCTCRAAPRL
jgi:outer membrane immunogenic protein